MNIGDRLKNAMGQVAPKVAGALAGSVSGGLAGPLAEGVVRRVSSELLGTEYPEPDLLEDRLQNLTPEDRAKLAKIEADLEAELANVAAKDRANARAREAETGDRTPQFLAFAILALFAAVLLGLFFIQPPEGIREVLVAMVGVLGGLVGAVANYFFGSSTGSKQKTALLGSGR